MEINQNMTFKMPLNRDSGNITFERSNFDPTF